MKRVLILLMMTVLLLASCRAAMGAGQGVAVIPGAVQVDATFDHLGVIWWISGDDDLDSAFTLEYRLQGDVAWRTAAPPMRAYPTIYVQDGPLGLNSWGASALFLAPGQTYDLRLTLTDPDGGGETRQLTATTRTLPQPDPAGRRLHVVPGSGGGDGSTGNPFRGLQAAADAAQSGDWFDVGPGTYTPFQLLTSGASGRPILFRGPGDGSAIVDGGNTSRGVITLGEFNQDIAHVILQGLTIQNGRWGIDAQRTQNILIHHNLIQDVSYGILNRRDGAQELNQTVCDNTISGRTSWPGSGIPSERGIDLRGTGNVVCYNTVRYFGDCISVQPFTGPSFGNDVFGNDVSFCVDDGIEVDYNQANVRVWRNRVMNARMGVSLQPIRGGPAYIFRNEFFNLESVPIKMHNYTTGFYVIHNTGAKHGNGHGDNGAMWRNAVFRNNIFLGTRYAFEFTTIPDEGYRDFDYNAWGTTRIVGPGGPFFKWNNVRYDTLADLPPGVEDNGVSADFTDLVNAALPPGWDAPVTPGSRDLRLLSGSPENDAGIPLPNLNDRFVVDGQPDMGAFEFGQPLPGYGPRPLRPDLSTSSKQASLPGADFGQTITYTISLLNRGAPLTDTVTLTDTVPAGLAYVPGSLSASQGTADDSGAPTLRWTGDQLPLLLTYAVTVTATGTQVIINTVDVDAGTAGRFSRSATLITAAEQRFLPLVPRD